jgi:hypothetical protein
MNEKACVLATMLVLNLGPFAFAETPRYADLANGVPVVNQTAAGELDSTGWCRAVSKSGGYGADLPNKYADTMAKIPGTNGSFMVMHAVTTDMPIGGKIGLVFFEVIGQRPQGQDPFTGMTEGYQRRGALKKRERVQILNFEADHLLIETGTDRGEMYRISSQKGDYLLSFQYPATVEKVEFLKIRDRVLSSLKLDTGSQPDARPAPKVSKPEDSATPH